MAYQLPGRYSNDDDDYSEGEFSEDISIDQEYESEFDESERHEEKRRPARRGSHQSARSAGGGRQLPGRSKSFEDDGRRPRGPPERSRSGDGGRPGGRHTPRRSRTFDADPGNARMPRREHSMLDKETIASNRARRLRAMGGGDKNKEPVRFVRKSQSFKQERSGSGLSAGGGEEEKKDDRQRKPPRRSLSNDLAPEEQQYARTAARGVTRSKSLKAERPDLNKASKDVAARLGKLSGAPKGAAAVGGLKF